MRQHGPFLVVFLLVLLFVFLCRTFFPFTAEDAFITARYAENLVEHGELVFNPGEPVCAVTSPLHTLVEAGLYRLLHTTLVPWKWLALALTLASIAMAARLFRWGSPTWFLLLVLLLLSPAVQLWTFGGLETPLLMFLITAMVVLFWRGQARRPLGLVAIHVLAGLAFLARFDAAIFCLPLLIHCWFQARGPGWIAVSVLAGVVGPVAWLAFAWHTYGEILPTSFFIKTPVKDLKTMQWFARILRHYLWYAGILPVVIFALLRFPTRHLGSEIAATLRRHWGLWLGLLLLLGYGCTAAGYHMFFSNRLMLPYLPAMLIVIADLLESSRPAARRRPGRLFGGPALVILVALLGIWLGYQNGYTWQRSVNGILKFGEYSQTSTRTYVREFIPALLKNADEAREHWQQVGHDEIGSGRLPRVHTFGAGALPYAWRETYIYEALVSYRHDRRLDLQGAADYLHIITPLFGTTEEQLPGPKDGFELISSQRMDFEGGPQRVEIWYNPRPTPHILGARVGDRCLDRETGDSNSSDPP